MPEDVIRKLAGFTPAPPAVDRDELLFQAGRASAPSPRWWRRATAALLVTQAVTLGAWLAGPSRTPTAVPTDIAPAPAPAMAPEPAAPTSYLVLSHNWETVRRPAGPDDGTEHGLPPDDPLTAGDRRLAFD
ncbi:MAG: hypothetical protein U0871_09240 [Gemmataceae bacterium]